MSYTDIKFLNLIAFRLRNFKNKKNGLFNFSCPFCGDSQRNPRKARGYVYRNMGKYFYKCHNCNINTHISKLIELVDPAIYSDYKLESYMESDDTPSKVYVKPQRFDILPKMVYSKMEYCSLLAESHQCSQYLMRRKIPRDQYYRLWYSDNFHDLVGEVFPEFPLLGSIDEHPRLVIPFFNADKEITAISGRALQYSKQRYMTARDDGIETIVFGLDVVDRTLPIKVVEGPLDSLFLSNTIASGDANLQGAVNTLEGDFTFIYDNEPRNLSIIRNMEKCISGGNKIVIWPSTVARRGKDINEMILSGLTSEDIEKIIKDNTYTGIMATMNLNLWRRV